MVPEQEKMKWYDNDDNDDNYDNEDDNDNDNDDVMPGNCGTWPGAHEDRAKIVSWQGWRPSFGPGQMSLDNRINSDLVIRQLSFDEVLSPSPL